MPRIWRTLFYLSLAAIIAPAVLALTVYALGVASGCAADAPSCDGGSSLGATFAFMLDWAWHRIINWPILVALTLGAAIGAGFGYETRMQAILAGAMGACWAPIAALILPYIAVGWSVPPGCMMTDQGTTGCVVWGQPMNATFGAATVAFWLALIVVPVALTGIGLTMLFAVIHHRHAKDFTSRPR